MKIYVWLPPFFLRAGHAALEIETNLYLSFWPANNENWDKKSKKKKTKSFGGITKGFTYINSYEEDCCQIGRRAEQIIEIVNMPTNFIKDYWQSLKTSNYNFILQNCSTVVGNALLKGYDEYLSNQGVNIIKRKIELWHLRECSIDPSQDITDDIERYLVWIRQPWEILRLSIWLPEEIVTLSKFLKEQLNDI